MEKDTLYFNKLYLTKNDISINKENKYFKIVLIIVSIICIFLIFNLIFNNYKQEKIIKKYISLYEDLKIIKINLEKNLTLLQKKNMETINNLKKENIENIDFEQNLLKLYVENRAAYYLEGRKKEMKLIGSSYNDSNIVTIQDKYNWLLIHDSPENKTNLVDKILLHDYSKKILGKDICVPIIKIYNSIDEIDIDNLPDKFVLKCNHGSGMNILCKDKKNFNIMKAKQLLNKWMNINYGLRNHEYQYINVKKKVFVEQYLCDDILDYKFYCFNGEPKFIRVQKHLKGKSIHNYYNLNFTLNEIETNMPIYIRRPDIKFPRPKHLDKMIELAKKFSEKFIFVRVDLYEVNDTIYLGELTFSPINVQMPYKDRNQSEYLGSLLDIHKKSINNIN